MKNTEKRKTKQQQKVSLVGYNMLALRDRERGGGTPPPPRFHEKICQNRLEMSHFENETYFKNKNSSGLPLENKFNGGTPIPFFKNS
jgi:hypothetical protein